MNTLEGVLLYTHYKNLLETEDKKYAWKVLHEFFEAFDEEGPQETLWFMLAAVMKLESEDVDGKERGNIIFFYEYSVALFKAAYVLYKHHYEKKSANDSNKEIERNNDQ